MIEGQITRPGGRRVAFADYGAPDGLPVFHCHGAPGSRHQPHSQAQAARALGLRVIGVDRPGYGLSTPQPGREIADGARDLLAVADHLDIESMLVVGASTGGAYALALAELAPQRVAAVVLCCAMADMRWARQHAPMTACDFVWSAPNRATATARAVSAWGHDGSRLIDLSDAASSFPPADLAFMANPALAAFVPDLEPFRQGVAGLVDDRMADGPAKGWFSFDVRAVRCPVTILHGERDTLVPVAHARHIASLLPQARLEIFANDGHLSINDRVLPAVAELRSRLTALREALAQ
jgi:pimeloyl-ACP methyl ester carboxylesterase